jgi:hypothetical protein
MVLIDHPTSGSARTRIAWPIFVIGLGVVLTLVWMTFLAWEAAITIVTMVT